MSQASSSPSEHIVALQSKWLEYTHDEAEQMKGLVDDLLFLAKSDAARQPAARAETAISEVALGCLLPFESVAFESGVALEHRITLGLSLRGDEGRSWLMILLDNAVKYAGPGGTVTLTLERHQERLRLAVHNTGEPIPSMSTSPPLRALLPGGRRPGRGGAATAWGWPLPGASWRATTGGSPSPAPPRPAPPSPPCSPAGDGFACQDGAAVVKWACSRRSWKMFNSCPLL